MAYSGSAIADGLVSIFSAASLFGSYVSKDDYSVMEQSPDTSMVISFRGYHGEASDFANDFEESWKMRLRMFIRDTGDPVAMNRSVWSTNDNVISTLKSNPTLNGTVDEIVDIDAEYEGEESLVYRSGAAWHRVTYILTAVNVLT